MYIILTLKARTGAIYVPRRTLTYTPIRQAQNNDGPPEGNESPSAFNRVKNLFGFGGKSQRERKPEPAKPKAKAPSAPEKREGTLSADSIFAEDDKAPKRKPAKRPVKPGESAPTAEAGKQIGDYTVDGRDWDTMRTVLDPDPQKRRQWEREMIAQEIRRRGRISPAVQIMRTERESLSKSHWFKTSIKKLSPLARQIAGKNIDEAILQMRFSKKKAAKDVLEHLKHAKNVAIVRNGLGSMPEQRQEPVTAILKSGERVKISDPSAIYIAQAWVNRGPYGVEPDHRAYGRIFKMRPPHTGLSVLLKEEKTRIREWRDREAKAMRERKSQLWTQLPDRPITQQSQYYCW